MTRKILIAIILVLVIIQFIPALPQNKESDPSTDFLAVHPASEQISSLMKTSCYDCHSQNADWPWYAHVAPVSFWLAHHVNEGREHLNFSIWSTYSAKKKRHQLEEMAEHVEKKEMPLESYTWMHQDANLSPEQRDELVAYFKSLKE